MEQLNALQDLDVDGNLLTNKLLRSVGCMRDLHFTSHLVNYFNNVYW